MDPNGLVTDCDLVIPNQEIFYLYQGVLKKWVTESYSDDVYSSFLHMLANADIAGFVKQLNNYLMMSGSVRDFYQEGHYHAFVLGLACGLMHTHHVYSNRESGWGYADMIIIPKDMNKKLAVIFEFKHVTSKYQEASERLDAIKEAAQAGLDQITLKRYDTKLNEHPHVTEVAFVGVAFCGKMAGAYCQRIDLQTKQSDELLGCFPDPV